MGDYKQQERDNPGRGNEEWPMHQLSLNISALSMKDNSKVLTSVCSFIEKSPEAKHQSGL